MGGDTRVRLLFTCGQVGGSPGFSEDMLRQDFPAKAPPVRAGLPRDGSGSKFPWAILLGFHSHLVRSRVCGLQEGA